MSDLKVARLKARLLGYLGQNCRPPFGGVVERKRVVCPTCLLHDLVRTDRSIMHPAKSLQCCQYAAGLRGRPKGSCGDVEDGVGGIRGQFPVGDPVQHDS